MQYQYFNKQKFAKYKGCKYWQNTRTTERMHRYVWEFYNGAIPSGFDVHHIDHNVDNNNISNLELLSKKEHQHKHSQERTPEEKLKRKLHAEKIRVLSKAWHKSEVGRNWHKNHFKNMKDKLFILKDFKCLCCGKDFKSTKTGSKYCCNACKSKHRRILGLDLICKKCINCGKEFKTNKYSKVVTCCRKCTNEIRKNQEN